MPTYDYKCKNCGNLFEVFQGINEPHHTECPKCKGPVKRLIGSGGGIIFKGSGFYETDYKNKGCKEKESKEKKPHKNKD